MTMCVHRIVKTPEQIKICLIAPRKRWSICIPDSNTTVELTGEYIIEEEFEKCE
jgi:hypothetical protein